MTAEKDNKLRIIEDAATGNRFVTYDTKGGPALEVMLTGDDDKAEPWFTQKDMAAIFGVTVPDVSKHIKNFIEDGELDDSVIANFSITAPDGKTYPTKHYGLDVAFYVGYRVNSAEGKQFRKWATRVLVQVATKGFYIDRRKISGDISRLREIRQIIADIRSDEATMYAELRSIFSTCKDYDAKSKESHEFSRISRTACCTPSLVSRQRNSFANGRVPRRRIWG